MIPSAERDGPVVEAALREAGFSQIEWHLMIPSMEDVFIDHVTKKGAS
jgi:hypothetical protein